MCSSCPTAGLKTHTSNRKKWQVCSLTYLELFQVFLFAMFTFYCVTETVCWIGIKRRSVKYTNFQTLSNILRLWETLHHRSCYISSRIPSDGTTLSTWKWKEERKQGWWNSRPQNKSLSWLNHGGKKSLKNYIYTEWTGQFLMFCKESSWGPVFWILCSRI